jgi:hypothetical protein
MPQTQRLIILALSCLSVGGVSQAKLPEYDCEIQGNLEWIDYTFQGSESDRLREFFTVWIQGSEWLIRTGPIPEGAAGTMAAYHETGLFDNATYSVTLLNTNEDKQVSRRSMLKQIDQIIASSPPDHAAKLKPTKEQMLHQIEADESKARSRPVNNAVAQVEPLPYPDASVAGHTALIWMAFCSHASVVRGMSETVPQVWPYEHPLQTVAESGLPGFIAESEKSPFLPTRIVFVNPGLRFEMSGTNLTRVPLGAPFSHGYTNAEYQVDSFTNVQGLVLPLSFSLVVFAPKAQGETAADLRTIIRCTGRTVAVRIPCGRESFLPILPATTAIMDRRTHSQYFAPSGPWPITTNLHQLSSFDRKLLATIELHRNRRRFIAISGLALVLSFPLLVILLRTARTRRVAV